MVKMNPKQWLSFNVRQVRRHKLGDPEADGVAIDKQNPIENYREKWQKTKMNDISKIGGWMRIWSIDQNLMYNKQKNVPCLTVVLKKKYYVSMQSD